MLPLPAPQKVKCFRVRFRFQLLSLMCFRFHKNLTASASTSLSETTVQTVGRIGNRSWSLTSRLSGVEGERGKWRHAPQGASTHLIQPFKNAVLSRNLNQIMSKNAYFWKKAVKSPKRRGLRP